MSAPAYWGAAYGIPEGPWETFGGPAPVPAMQWRVTSIAPANWPRGWVQVPDARSLRNVLELMDGANFHGIELREVAAVGQLELPVAS